MLGGDEVPDYSHLANPGLAVAQLCKMKAKGLISLQQFLELTAEAAGQHEERPIELDESAANDSLRPAAARPRTLHAPPFITQKSEPCSIRPRCSRHQYAGW